MPISAIKLKERRTNPALLTNTMFPNASRMLDSVIHLYLFVIDCLLISPFVQIV